MYFNSLERITNYIKTAQFEPKLQQNKIETSATSSKDSGNVSSFLIPNNDLIKAQKAKRIEDIKNKMKSGRKLSHAEKEFSRINAPDLYEKVIKIEKERDEFRKALANCKTKGEVLIVRSSKNMELQAKGQDAEFLEMRMMATFNEFADFVKSEEYADIPNEYKKDAQKTEDTKNSGKGKKLKKTKLTLKEEMALNSYKLNEYKLNEAEILNKVNSSESAKPNLNTSEMNTGESEIINRIF